MTPKPDLETEVKTKVATSTKISLGITVVAALGAIIAIATALFTA